MSGRVDDHELGAVVVTDRRNAKNPTRWKTPPPSSGKRVLDGTPDYVLRSFADEIKVQRRAVLGECAWMFTRLLHGIEGVLDRQCPPYLWGRIDFETILWTKEGQLVLPMMFQVRQPNTDRRDGLDDFVDDVMRFPFGPQNLGVKSLIAGLTDQLAVAHRYDRVDLRRVAFQSVRATRQAEILADIRLGRRAFRPLEVSW